MGARAGRSQQAMPRLEGGVAMHVVQEDGHPAARGGAARQAQVGLLQPGPRQEDRRLDSPYFPCANVSLELSSSRFSLGRVDGVRLGPGEASAQRHLTKLRGWYSA